MRHILLLLALLPTVIHAQDIIYNTGSLINELNVAGQSDAYPWLSADGLRLYYSKDVDGTISHIGYAIRPDAYSPFQLVDTYLAGLTVDGSSCWLSPDELTIYFSAAGQIRRASRAAIGEQFSAPVTLTLLGVSSPEMRSPSLTPDGSQLYLRDFNTNDFQHFTLVAPDTYSIEGPVSTGLSQLGTGKLDHSGLRYYFSADDGTGHRVYRMSRASLGDPFGDPQPLTGSAFTSGYHWIQPAVAADETQMVLVRGQTEWQQNDLYLASGTLSVGMQHRWMDPPAIWPNPANAVVHLRIPEMTGNVNVQILDMNGKLVSSVTTSGTGTLQYDVSGLPAGLYVISIVSNNTSERTLLTISR